jgi:gas vesicle protein
MALRLHFDAPEILMNRSGNDSSTAMTSTLCAGLIGASIGGASMFLLDPDRGARRRALLRDQAARAARKTRDAAGATRRDLGNRWSGLKSRAAAGFSDEAVDDTTLCARVRAILGHVTDHPRAICVGAANGLVTLTGDALETDVPSVVAAVGEVRGVKGIQNEIRAHATADGISDLQGGTMGDWARNRWSPTAMLLAGTGVAAGAVLGAAALARSNGHSSADKVARDARTAPPSTEQEAAEAFETEIGILIVGTAPTERGTFATDELSS